MTAASHRLGGLAAGVVLANLLHTGPVGSGMVLVSSMLGCLLPDIDNRQSAISYKFKLARFFVSVGQTVLRGISCLFPKKQKRYIRSLIGHRGLSHSLAPVVILPLVVILFGKLTGSLQTTGYIAAGTAAGILSHLIFDMFSGGVPLLMPFSVKRITLAHIKTGGVVEWLFRIVLIVVFCYFGLIKEVIPWQRLLQL